MLVGGSLGYIGANDAGALLSSIWHSQMCQRVCRPGSCTVARGAARVTTCGCCGEAAVIWSFRRGALFLVA